MQVDANFQKYGSMFLIEANSLSGGTGLSVVSTSSKSAVRSDIFKVEGKCTKNTALQMLRLVQKGRVSKDAYYKPSVSLAVDTNLAESIFLSCHRWPVIVEDPRLCFLAIEMGHTQVMFQVLT